MCGARPCPTQSSTQRLGGRLGGTLHTYRWDAILMRVTRMSRASAHEVMRAARIGSRPIGTRRVPPNRPPNIYWVRGWVGLRTKPTTVGSEFHPIAHHRGRRHAAAPATVPCVRAPHRGAAHRAAARRTSVRLRGAKVRPGAPKDAPWRALARQGRATQARRINNYWCRY